MRHQSLKKYLATSIKCWVLAAAAALLVQQQAFACSSGSDCSDGRCSSVFSPEIIGDLSCQPFFWSDRAFYLEHGEHNIETRETIAKINTQEWSGVFGGQLTDSMLDTLLYQMDRAEVMIMKSALNGAKIQLTPSVQGIYESLVSAVSKDTLESFFSYLIFAKGVERLATSAVTRERWGLAVSKNPDATDVEEAEQMVQKGRQDLAAVSDPQLQARYHFQILRMLFYSQKYADAIAYYDANVRSFNSVKSIRYRSMELAAGALRRTQQYARSNYLFSLIFDQYPPLQKNAFISFRPQEQQDWVDIFKLVQNDREKITVWQMLGFKADGVEAIRQIYAIDPKSETLSILIVREVNKIEEGFFYKNSYMSSQQRPGVNVEDMKILRSIADAGNTSRPYVWLLSIGHLYALMGQGAEAESFLNRAAQASADIPVAAEQARLSLFFSRVNSLRNLRNQEDYFAQELSYLKNQQRKFPETRGGLLLSWSIPKIGEYYSNRGDWLRATLVADADKSIYVDNKRIQAVVAFMRQSHASPLDRALVSQYTYSEDELLELQGINLMYAGLFTEAAAVFSQMKPSVVKLKADPFAIRIRDCHECDSEALPNKIYDKASFAKKMAELSQKSVDPNTSIAAQASFSMGNALYNISYYGNSRGFYQTPHSNFGNLTREVSMTMAERYYSRAAMLATDREFKAKALFMAAKCEQNSYFESRGGVRNQYFLEPLMFSGGLHFTQLKQAYADTAFYREALQECGTFRAFVRKK